MTTLEWPGLRPAGRDDDELLYRVYASTREAELTAVPWTDAVKEAFLRMQFAAQDSHFHASYPGASNDLIVEGDEVLGRLHVDRAREAWLVIEIALFPAYQGKGIGTRLLRKVLAEAETAGKPVRLYVERFNPAQRLYGRLGFRLIADEGVYLLLEWRPGFRGAAYPKTTS